MALFLDANVAMYAAGREHPIRGGAVEVIRLAGRLPGAFVTDVEVFQEILHRYLSQRLWEAGRVVFTEFRVLMSGRIEAVLAADIERAAALADTRPHADARDLLHVAVMERLGCTHIVSADRGFDALPEITRLDPVDVADWRALVEP